MSGHHDEPAAFFAGVRNFGKPDEYREIEFRHDGTADIGNLRFAKGGAIEFREDRTSDPFMRFGGAGKTLQDVINLHNHTDLPVGLQGVNLQYLTPADGDQVRVLPGHIEVRYRGSQLAITAQISMSLELNQVSGATGVSVAHLELLQDGQVYSQLDYATILLSYNPQENLPAESLDGGASAAGYDGSNWRGLVQHNVDVKLSGVPKGLYTLRLKYNTIGVDIREGGVSVINPYMVSNWIASTSEIFATKGQFCVVRGKNILYMDAESGFTLRGKVDMPGYLGGGRVDAQGQMPFRDGKIVSCEKSFTSYNHSHKYKIHHSIGHTNYSVSVLPIGNERMFPRLREYTSSYFVVDFFHAPEEEYEKTWPTGFTFTVHGSNA